jgi:hypothetical protein
VALTAESAFDMVNLVKDTAYRRGEGAGWPSPSPGTPSASSSRSPPTARSASPTPTTPRPPHVHDFTINHQPRTINPLSLVRRRAVRRRHRRLRQPAPHLHVGPGIDNLLAVTVYTYPSNSLQPSASSLICCQGPPRLRPRPRRRAGSSRRVLFVRRLGQPTLALPH